MLWKKNIKKSIKTSLSELHKSTEVLKVTTQKQIDEVKLIYKIKNEILN